MNDKLGLMEMVGGGTEVAADYTDKNGQRWSQRQQLQHLLETT